MTVEKHKKNNKFDNPTKTMGLSLCSSYYEILRKYAGRRGISMAKAICEQLDFAWMAKQGGTNDT